MQRLFLIALLLSAGRVAQAADAELVDARKIWDKAPHNAFTDLIRFKDRWYCVFREGTAHVSPDGALRVITSADGDAWESAALITSPDSDLRDAKITITPTGQLMLSGAGALHDQSTHHHQSLVWFSDNGRDWGTPHKIGDPDFWLWRTTWHKDVAYSIGYGTRDTNTFVRLYKSADGKKFETLVENLMDEGYPNESSMVFLDNDNCYCLLRRDDLPGSGLLGTSQPPYKNWEWRDLRVRIGGPHMIRLPDGRFVAAVRLYDNKARTSLCWLDPKAGAGTLKEFLPLPSGGDTSYAGLVWHDNLLWVSYYSSHEEKTSIYLARVRIHGTDSK
ncbi:MAG: exo-alpha-sialidase [Planctomycetaceae bacterium]